MNLIKKYRVKINEEKNEPGLGGHEPAEFEVVLEETIILVDTRHCFNVDMTSFDIG